MFHIGVLVTFKLRIGQTGIDVKNFNVKLGLKLFQNLGGVVGTLMKKDIKMPKSDQIMEGNPLPYPWFSVALDGGDSKFHGRFYDTLSK